MTQPLRTPVNDMIQEPTGKERPPDDVIGDLEIAPKEVDHDRDAMTTDSPKDETLDDLKDCKETSFATLDGEANSIFSSKDTQADDNLMDTNATQPNSNKVSSLQQQAHQSQLTCSHPQSSSIATTWLTIPLQKL